MIINHNLAALNTYNRMETNQTAGQKSLEKLSSGMRINRAGDDAAGLAISEKMRAQIRGLDQATRNAQDGISMIQTAEGGLNEVHSILQRMRELADQSANGTNTAEDRSSIQSEVSQLKSEIDRIGNTTEFNTQKLLNGNLQSSGVVAGQNVTTSAVIAKLTAGKMTSAGSLGTTSANSISFSGGSGTDTFSIDGHDIAVNWDTLLTASQKSSLQGASVATGQAAIDVKNIITNAMNQAIDNYNASNAAGATVGHVSAYFEATTNKLVLQSSTQGVNSRVDLKTMGASTSVGAKLLSSDAGSISTGNIGTNTYAGNAIANTAKITFQINGQTAQVSAPTVSVGEGMASVATDLQAQINIGIASLNSAAGKTSTDTGYIRDVKVTVSDDGRLQISDESGAVTFNELDGQTTIHDLGLSQAQTDASGNGGMTFQIGANKGQTITFGINDMRTSALGISGVDVSTAAGASDALNTLDGAVKKVSAERAKLGAVQNRLEHTVNNLGTSSENLTAAESRIRDVDMAKEMMNLNKTNILTQAAQAMMAQANQLGQGVLQLLK